MKTKKTILLATACLAFATASLLAQLTSSLPTGLISLSSPEGERLLDTSGARTSFYKLTQSFTTQQKSTYCGVATAVTVLNAVHPSDTPPCDTLNGKIKYFDQDNFFSKAVEEVIPQTKVQQHGFTLSQWAAAVGTYVVQVEKWHCGTNDDEADYAKFVAKAKSALASTNQFLVVNFLRRSLGQTGKVGHFSPVGAYNEKENKMLVLDVARFHYPPFWVDAKSLWDAMNTGDEDKHRGFVIITAMP
jgi:Phytochelatin synthase